LNEEYGKKTRFMATLLDEIVEQNDPEAFKAGLKLLIKLNKNVLDSPSEEKFRTMKKSNKVIAAKLFSLKGGIIELIRNMGYYQVDDEHFVFLGNYFKVLQAGNDLTEQTILKLN
jgi:hypothetical protein